eukprot:298813_1
MSDMSKRIECGHIQMKMSPDHYATWFMMQDFLNASADKLGNSKQFICNICFILLIGGLLQANQYEIIALMYYRFGKSYSNINYFILRHSALWKICWSQVFHHVPENPTRYLLQDIYLFQPKHYDYLIFNQHQLNFRFLLSQLIQQINQVILKKHPIMRSNDYLSQ